MLENVSFVICCRPKDKESVLKTIESLPTDSEVVIFENYLDEDAQNDREINVARDGNSIYINYVLKEFNFSKIRNLAAAYATKEWLFFIDADEILLNNNDVVIEQVINSTPPEIGGIKVIISSLQTAPDRTIVPIFSQMVRLIRNHKGFTFQFWAHETAELTILKSGYKIGGSPIRLEHSGYTTTNDAMVNKLKRNVYLMWSNFDDIQREGAINHYLDLIIRDANQIKLYSTN